MKEEAPGSTVTDCLVHDGAGYRILLIFINGEEASVMPLGDDNESELGKRLLGFGIQSVASSLHAHQLETKNVVISTIGNAIAVGEDVLGQLLFTVGFPSFKTRLEHGGHV